MAEVQDSGCTAGQPKTYFTKEFEDLLSLADYSRELQQSKTNLSDPLNESFDEPGGGENFDDFDELLSLLLSIISLLSLEFTALKCLIQSTQVQNSLRNLAEKY